MICLSLQERVERDGLPAANPIPIPKPQRATYHHSGEYNIHWPLNSIDGGLCCSPVVWSQDVYQRAVENHRDDIAILVDPEVVTDCLVSEGVFSPSAQNYITSAESDEKISRFLEKVEEKRAYQVSFSILQETGEQLPAHGRLWDILNETCNGKLLITSFSINSYNTFITALLQRLTAVDHSTITTWMNVACPLPTPLLPAALIPPARHPQLCHLSLDHPVLGGLLVSLAMGLVELRSRWSHAISLDMSAQAHPLPRGGSAQHALRGAAVLSALALALL